MSSLERRVAVIGGGLSGLVAFKRLVDAGIVPTLISKNIGGMWNASINPFWPAMRTNLSKHTCAFSDHEWAEKTSVFPSQADVNTYLSEYATKYIKPENAILGCEVTHISACEDGTYKVEWTDSADQSMSDVFDDVVVTTGFFSKPAPNNFTNFQGRIIHSSKYLDPSEFANRNVIVVGSSFSSAEISADVATVAKSVRNVVSRPSWILPRFLPLDADKPNTPFLPADLLFYQLNAQKDTLEARREVLFKTDLDRTRSNGYMSKLVGGKDEDVMAELRAQEIARAAARGTVPSVSTGISDNFTNLVRSDHIQLVQGYLRSTSGTSVYIASTRDETGTVTELKDVDDVILCTGFTPALHFLDPRILGTLDYVATDGFQPLLLHRDVLHPDLPGLYFVGMYRGPYFAGMELQARAVASYISGQLARPSETEMRAGVETSDQIRHQVPRPQFPHADYIGMSFDWMRELGLTLPVSVPVDSPLVAAGLPESGSYVFSPEMLTTTTVSQLAKEIQDCNGGKYLSQTIFRALQGEWAFERTLISKLESSPSGTVVGKISLSRGDRASSDLVYVEKDKFTTTRGMQLDVDDSQYVYALNEDDDCIDIFFADKETGRQKERKFVSLKVVGRDETGWIAVGEPHSCAADTYVVRFHLSFRGLALQRVEIQIDVKGPFKDYQSSTVLTKYVA